MRILLFTGINTSMKTLRDYLDLIRELDQPLTEKWTEKYKRSINCSHPKGFSQRAHCAGKKKHNEDVEMTCPDCGLAEGQVVPFRRSPTQAAWQKITPDVLQLANDWFWANDDTNTLQSVTDQDYGQGAENLVKYIQAQLQSKGWTIDFDDEIDNIILRNRQGQTVALPVNDAYDGHGWAEGTLDEDWNKVNHHDRTNGLSQKAVNAYRREHPGSHLQTAVTTKPSKLKPGSKAAKRRKSFCARMRGNKGPMQKPNGKPTPKALALRRWHCESLEEMRELIQLGEQYIAELKRSGR